jgi:myo-inositol-1(or 4)-monophosphatase
MKDLLEFQQFAKHLADISGQIIIKYFRSEIIIEHKDDNSPVTIADKIAEELMREEILKAYPEHGIIGEEFDEHLSKSSYKWVLDPIDGTKSFICGTVNFGTLIALLKDDKPLFGAFHQPILREFLVGDNESTFLNSETVKVRNCKNLSDAVLLTTDYLSINKYQNVKKFNNLMHSVKFVRGWGDCYGYYLLSTGFADIMVDPIMSLWDIAAIVPIVRGAGGTITDYEGNDPIKGNSIIASAPLIHDKIIKILNT